MRMMNVFYHRAVVLALALIMFRLMAFCFNRTHLLSLLLSLEAVMLGIFCFGLFSISLMKAETYYTIAVLTFAACEAAIGLSILVNIVSSHGSNYVSSLNLSRC